MFKLEYKNPKYVYSSEKQFLMVTTEEYLEQWLDLGFKEITENQAKALKQYADVKNLVK